MRSSSWLWLLSSLLAFSLLLSCSSLCGNGSGWTTPAYTVTVFSASGDDATDNGGGNSGSGDSGSGDSGSGNDTVRPKATESPSRRPVTRAEPPICGIARGMAGCEHGHNRGYWPDRWNRHVHNPPGTPYCAAALSFLLDSCRARSPTVRSGLARSFRTSDSFSALDVLTGKRIVPAGCIIGWNLGNTINGHTGITMEEWKGTQGSSWQANSTFARCRGGRGTDRDGGGWGTKTARIEPYAYLRIRWFTPIVH